MNSLLEVIVTCIEEALEAQAGGADRLELLAAPEHAGLTPSLHVVADVLQAVSIPVRVMLRHKPSMSLESAAELKDLQESAAQFSRLGIDGIVTGFTRNGEIDEQALREISAAVPGTPLTFHRAFDTVADQSRAIAVLKQFPQVDRLLTAAGTGKWPDRLALLSQLQAAAKPQIRILFAASKDASRIADLRSLQVVPEVHVGRAAREPRILSGTVSRSRVAALKQALNSANQSAMRCCESSETAEK